MTYLFLIIIYLLFSYVLGKDILNTINMFFKLDKIVFNIIYYFIVLIIPFSFINLKYSFIKVIASTLFSFFINLFIIFIIKYFICLFINDLNIIKYINIFSLIICFLVTIYGIFNGLKINIKSYEFDYDLGNNYKIALISDVHLGSTGSMYRLNKMVDMINESNCDLLLIAGDLFDNDTNKIKDKKYVINKLKDIKTRFGKYMVLGNHDSGNTFTSMIDIIKSSDINLLIDEYVNIDNKFNIIGRMEIKPMGKSTSKRIDFDDIIIDNNLKNIILDHNPERIDEYKGDNLILCGHTHDGQVFPANIITKFMYKISYGYKKINGNDVIVSSGVGTWGLNERIGSKNEIVIINIR